MSHHHHLLRTSLARSLLFRSPVRSPQVWELRLESPESSFRQVGSANANANARIGPMGYTGCMSCGGV